MIDLNELFKKNMLKEIMWKNLNPKVTNVQLAEDFMDNLQTLSIWNHGIILSCYVKILQDTQMQLLQCQEFSHQRAYSVSIKVAGAINAFQDD